MSMGALKASFAATVRSMAADGVTYELENEGSTQE
jgi:hypothetical protein